MDDLLVLFTGAAVLAALLTNVGLWSPRRLWVKLGALAIAAMFLPTAYLSMVSLLSRPKPLTLEWSPPDAENTTVLAAQMKEEVAIYLWVQRADSEEPRAYVLPWDEQLARELHEAQKAAEAEGGNVQVRLVPKVQNSEPSERMFYASPPPAPPPKVAGDAGPAS